MPSQIILFDQSRSASHLLAKVLSKQPKLEKLQSLYSACRGKQVEWLTSDDWENGMAEADYSAFKASARTATAAWQEALVQSKRDASTLKLQGND
ncbi:MAG: Uncharacterized protein AUREO_013330 [Aureobasidium pullulans]|nr:MAG: Uncharacterized protein AUREO_013330 [Aureobasidium pullulans]